MLNQQHHGMRGEVAGQPSQPADAVCTAQAVMQCMPFWCSDVGHCSQFFFSITTSFIAKQYSKGYRRLPEEVETKYVYLMKAKKNTDLAKPCGS
jgi:hypothetical protein